jgi:glycosyltransferase involved in cell wall biosynthesis
MINYKNLTRILWKFYNYLLTFFVKKDNNKDLIFKVYYGGARKGELGGPLVKVSRLTEYFPEFRHKIDLVYCLSNAPYLSEKSLHSIKKKNIPIVLNQNGVFSLGWYGPGWENQNNKLKPAYQIADFVFWQSKFCQYSAEKFLGMRQGPGEILYNAVDVSKFRPLSRSSKSNFTFLVSGKLTSPFFYRIEAALRAIFILQKTERDIELLVAGISDKLVANMTNSLISDLGIRDKVKLIGKYTQTEAPKIYNAADAYVMLKHMDASPNVVIEAMACGLPIIYSDTGGVQELVGKDAGIGINMEQDWSMVPKAPDPEKVSAAMYDVMSAHAKFSTAARSRAVVNFNLENWIGKHKAIFGRYVN